MALLLAGWISIAFSSSAQEELKVDHACFGAGILLFGALMAVAFAVDRAARRNGRGFESDQSTSGGGRQYTPRENRAWRLPPNMLSPHARAVWDRRAASERASATEREVSEAVRASLEAAARLLIRHAGVWAENEGALLRRCVQDRAFSRRLYRTAARRLHPDRNGGAQRAEWSHLQIAVARLRAYQENNTTRISDTH